MPVGVSFGMAMLSYRETVSTAAALDGVFSSLWIPDSQYLYRDCYVLLGGVAAAIRTAALGTLLTTPTTRHPTVVAAAAATVAEIAPGRVHLGLGTGDSAVRRLGLRPLRLADFARAVHEIREFYGQAGGDQAPAPPDWPVQRVPIHVVATGDRTLELGASVADGLVVCVGTDPGLLEPRIARIRQTRPESGFTIRSFNYVSIANDEKTAIAQLKPSITWFGINHPALVEDAGVTVDEEIMRRIGEFRDDYARYDLVHAHDWRRAMELAAFLPDDWVHAFGIAGTGRQFLDRVAELRAVGVEEIIVRAPCAALWRETIERVREAMATR
jgi:5,10-methylenetetrahydromethanopterin reductase